MDSKKTINATTEADIWHHINADFASGSPANYHAEIHFNNQLIQLSLVSSPGGNNEGGYEYTTISADLPVRNDFEFLIQPEDFLNRIGKFFGGQDIVLGYPEFDSNVLVKSNNPQQLKTLFTDEATRSTFVQLSGYSFGTTTPHEGEHKVLELHVQRAVTGNELKLAFEAFISVLNQLNAQV